MTLSSHEHQRRKPRVSRRVLRGFSREAFKAALGTMSAGELSRLSGVGVSTIHTWLAGSRTPQVDVLAKVLPILKVQIGDVVLIDPAKRYPGDWRVIMTGMTQPQLAAAADAISKMRTSTLQKIERGELTLSEENARALATVIGIPVAEYKAAYERARLREPGTPA